MITTPLTSQLTFEKFLSQLPDEEGYYELVNGEIMRKLPTRRHEDLADFILRQFDKEVERLQLNYRVSGRIVIKTETAQGQEQGRHPDITVVDKTLWEAQPTAYSALLEPPQLVVEIVSTNWEDDYVDKLEEYQRLGIPEYWIVDYLAVASRSYLGNPKLPTVFVCVLDENKTYQMNRYQGSERIISPTFPEFSLTVEELLTH
ncbi:Uma2 family endonuclease [Limnoraphis robusta]|uniref:Uma2 family endonuclease n=1 Tax=Limnoraphis robusta CCNP1315 TaxID=3110306 RepID=A0ABU5TVS3_9CYAN|nr:Uma2 family endonuclease [Limnoraphis robusta]MEA5519007.1 Uma2 family endonuclease [Limnoraphis robusta CCNP1315]MEA5544021.1 Uma2 family endonuclease [Limnoraphis robusta CCNP1324]